ncbi:MAG: hypothetical protein HBSIN02_17100 [Bacteroidia bacterium]|nr:MAG: hypothetical protein HBSIN02_17100 [Bacteroidia bacterium]
MQVLFTAFALLIAIVPIVLLIVLFVRTSSLHQRISRLEEHAGIRPERVSSTPGALHPPPLSGPTAKVEPPKVRSSGIRQHELEALIGGRLMNRIGAVALVIGMGFFLKYAFDHGWLSETMRVVIGIVFGFLCLWTGHRSRTRGYAIFAQGLVGAGIAILYLSLYASFNFYHLIPQWMAFILMSGVTILALVQAVRYDSLAVSILGWLGGFLTPFLLSTGESNEVALFTYAALLTLGLLGITLKKEAWYVLEPLSLGALFIVYFAWYAEFYTDGDFALTLFFLAVFWLLFHLADLLRQKMGFSSLIAVRHTVQSFHGLLTSIATGILVGNRDPDSVGIAFLALALVYALSVPVGRLLPGDSARGTSERLEAITAGLVLLGTAFEFSETNTIRLWAVEGLLLFLAGAQYRRTVFLISSLGFFACALIGFSTVGGSLAYEPIGDFALLGTPRVLTAVILAAAIGGATLISARTTSALAKKFRAPLGFTFLLTLFVVLTAETNDFFRHALHVLRRDHQGETIKDEITSVLNIRQLAISALWLVYSILAMAAGLWRGVRGPRYFAIGLFGLTILKIFIMDLAFLETLYRVFSFLGLGVILLAVSYAYQRYKSLLFDSVPSPEQRASS